ncbi:MAG TPA: hypothetical protein VGM39_00525 [Kofleriaceae bacterium]
MARPALVFVCVSTAMGCYSPDLPDCAVACTKDDDCAGDQACNAQGRCAAAGQECTAEMVDAGNGGTMDGSGSSARMVALTVNIMGEGKVTVTNVGDCTAPSGPMGCMFMVPVGRYEITAVMTKPDKPFEKWTSILCAAQSSTCNTDVVVGGTVSAKFH